MSELTFGQAVFVWCGWCVAFFWMPLVLLLVAT
jgi:hypothetical protein